MTPKEKAQVESEKTYAAFLKMGKRVSLWICILVFVVVVVFDSGV
tara:strand:- start:566 stop:700 length:135 start_codon:yes stop_codon:yes gene_type:complete